MLYFIAACIQGMSEFHSRVANLDQLEDGLPCGPGPTLLVLPRERPHLSGDPWSLEQSTVGPTIPAAQEGRALSSGGLEPKSPSPVYCPLSVFLDMSTV